ncbi:MAG: restriction endonuclease subunit S, partial [Planctomycetes bacterium]|nr:restriction endonuclease subunit S [Planctomycetota bacterium]
MTPDAFLALFDRFAEAPGAVGKMRDMVREFAVTGKLVSQEAKDKPTEITLNDLRLKNGIKGQGEAGSTESINGPCGLPESWKWIRLIDLFPEFQNGASSRGDKVGVPIVVLRLADITRRRISLNDTRTIQIDRKDAEKYNLRHGDTLITRVNGSADIVGTFVPVELDVRAIYCDHFIRMRIDPSAMNPAFIVLLGAARLVRSQIEVLFITTAGQKTVNQGHIGSLIIPLPPLAEQQRIVAKVDELMALCDRLEAQQQEREMRHTALARASLARFADAPTPANLDFLFHRTFTVSTKELRKAILTLAVTDRLVSFGPAWKRKPLESILSEASVNGVSMGPTDDATATEILRISAGTSGHDFFVDEDDFKHVDLPIAEVKKYQLAPGDLLACRFNGNLHYVGKFSYYRGASQRVQVNPDKLIRFRIDTDTNCPRYVCLAMNAPPTRQAIEVMCATTAGNIGLSAGRLKTIEIPLPPLPEQRRIVAKVDQLMALVDQLETQLAESRTTATRLMDAIVAELTGRTATARMAAASATTTGAAAPVAPGTAGHWPAVDESGP